MIVNCLFKIYSDNSFRWLEDFLKEYNQQRRVEAFFSEMKRRLGSSIRSRIGAMRRREVWMRILILKMLTVASGLSKNLLRWRASYVSRHLIGKKS
jgi:transposase